MDSDKIFSKDKLKVHMFYIIVVLILTLVVVITDRGYDNNDLSQWIAFGATLSGIILSVLAIILTLIGESKSDNTKDTFLNISKDLENIVDNVRKEFINVSTELENIKSEFLNTSEALDNVVYNVKHATKLFEEAKLDNKKIFQKFIDMQTNSKNTYCSEKEEENFNSLDYIGIYKKFVEKFDGDEYKYTLIMFYFFGAVARERVLINKDFIKSKEILAKYGCEIDSAEYARTYGTFEVFAPKILLLDEPNDFNKHISGEIKKRYPNVKQEIDDYCKSFKEL